MMIEQMMCLTYNYLSWIAIELNNFGLEVRDTNHLTNMPINFCFEKTLQTHIHKRDRKNTQPQNKNDRSHILDLTPTLGEVVG